MDDVKYSQADVEVRIAGLPDDVANRIVCALIGHSRVQTHCFGYFSCARCDDQVGDSLGGCYSARDVVIFNHHCDECRAQLPTLTWADTWRLDDKTADYLRVLADVEASRAAAAKSKADYEAAMAKMLDYNAKSAAARP